MTHSGGKPHAVGDRGQRYEVTYLDIHGKRAVMGWTDFPAGANMMCDSIDKHPCWADPKVCDRQQEPEK